MSDESFSDLVADTANEKNNFAKKVEISAQHIEWLKENQNLLNILLNYCTLHGACGGDVASMLRFLISTIFCDFTHEVSGELFLNGPDGSFAFSERIIR